MVAQPAPGDIAFVGSVHLPQLSDYQYVEAVSVDEAKRLRPGKPTAITELLTVPFVGKDLVPLLRPSILQLVRVRREHILDYSTASRSRQPGDLYSDPTIGSLPNRAGPRISRQPTDDLSASDTNSESTPSSSRDTADEDIQAIRHAHQPTPKRRRIEMASDSDSSQDQDYGDRSRQRGLVFQPSPIDRQVHDAVVHRRHTGKAPQMLLQSVQQSDQLDFIGTPPVLREAYHFGFGVGLSIMHFRRASPSDDTMSTENGMDMWDFSAKNSLRPPNKSQQLQRFNQRAGCVLQVRDTFLQQRDEEVHRRC
ncbi:unnamed protein product [Phytophthora fragariaefolia]|uniref:Unnamed protein product n=1 Tax=Phytophthora fragariaefolia TaxID=1490495 RepID=A0A9W6YPW3_9STRA|nr:unnamed protein product [Phytophthora fragariaefolia]